MTKKWMHSAIAMAVTMVSLNSWAGAMPGMNPGQMMSNANTVNVTGATGGHNGGQEKYKESLSISVVSGSDEVAGATCTLTNSKGDWSLTTPGLVTVKRADTDLQIKCAKDGFETAEQTVKASTTQIPRPQFKFATDGGGAGDDDTPSMITVPNYEANITVTLNSKAAASSN